MSYEDAFAAVPETEVLWCEYFGSYQGRLAARIIHKGVEGYILDYYGSCSGCDAFEAEMDYMSSDEPGYQQKLADFGKSYVEAAITLEQAVKDLTPKAGEWYDSEEKEMLERILSDHPHMDQVVRLLPRGEA